MNKKIKIGLIGLGYWGKNILRNLNELDLIHIACDSSQDTLDERKKSFPDVAYCLSHEDVLNNDLVNAVIISTPAVTHYEIVKQALISGKDVLVEKPLALNLAHGEELISLAKKHGRILMVGHILRYHPAVARLNDLLKEGELGKLQYIYSNRLNMGKLRTEENILWSFAPHDISVILSMTGEEPAKITCSGGSYLNENISDTTMTVMEFSGNIKAHIFVSWLHPFKEQKLVVVGSRAMAVFDDMAENKLVIYPHKIKWQKNKVPVACKAEHYPVELEAKEPLKAEIEHFVECVSKRKTPITDGEEGLRVLRVLENAENIMKHPDSTKEYFVHRTACVDNTAEIGAGTKIWNFSQVLKNSKIGKNNIIGQNVSIGPDVRTGTGCKIQNNVSVYKGVTLEDDVFCGPSCVFTNVYNPRAFIERKNEFLPTLVKKGATIGANATIVCGVTIGAYSMIGAGAVVKEDVPDHAVVAGVPARRKGWACKCGVSLRFNDGKKAVCCNCGSEYTMTKNKLKTLKETV
jgi:UDP-2-acetamido-3-amino-2,3-dideoxy-glucuronate N-acetyltransferase